MVMGKWEGVLMGLLKLFSCEREQDSFRQATKTVQPLQDPHMRRSPQIG